VINHRPTLLICAEDTGKGLWYGIVEFNVPLDTVYVISETGGKGLHFVKAINAIIALSLQISKQAPERYRAKRDVCPGSSVSTGAKFPLAPAELAPMDEDRYAEMIIGHHPGGQPEAHGVPEGRRRESSRSLVRP